MLFGNKGGSSVEWLIAGLGNPGTKYENTRHNMGFRAVELLAEQKGVKLNKVKFKSAYNICAFAGARCLVMKPQTYMNLSGQSVRQAAAFYKLPPERILVLFDDISLAPGRLRVRAEGSAGGHNGIKSIIAELGSQNFPRVKIGVGAKPHPDYDLADWVLSSFSTQEEKLLAPALERAGEAALCLLERGVPEAANRFNGAV